MTTLRVSAFVGLVILALAPASARAATSVPALVSQLTGDDPLAGQRAAERALALTGVTIQEGRHVVRRATAPATGVTMSPREALNDAIDLEGAPTQHLTLADLGVLWGKLHLVPAGTDPGVWLRGRLQKWLLAAHAHPSSPMIFPIVMLAALAQRRGIDIGAASYAPSSYGLGMLELQLFTSALMRVPKGAIIVEQRKRKAVASSGVGGCSDVIDEWLTTALKYYGATGPAADVIKFLLKQNLEQVTKQGGKYAAGALVYLGMDPTDNFANAKKQAGPLLQLLSLMMQVERLAEIYEGVRFYVDVNPGSVEKPEQAQNQTALGYGTFVATAGLNPGEEQKVKDALKNGHDFLAPAQAVKDCAKELGFPIPYDANDLAADLDKFRVQWTLHADPSDAVYENQKTKWFAFGSRIGLLQRAAPDLAAHVFYARIQSQPPWSFAPDMFEQRSHQASATAELQTDKALDPAMLIGILKSGGKSLFGPITKTVLGMLEKMHNLTDTGDLTITYHVPKCPGGGGTQARAAQDVCQLPLSATFSGSQVCAVACSIGNAVRIDWTGSMTGQPYVSPFGLGMGVQGWTIKTASAHVTVSGTIGDEITGTCEIHGNGDISAADLIAANGPSTPVFTLNAGTPQTYQFTLSSGPNDMTLSEDNCTGDRTPEPPFVVPLAIPLVKTGPPIARPSPTGPITFTGGETSGNSSFSWNWTITGV